MGGFDQIGPSGNIHHMIWSIQYEPYPYKILILVPVQIYHKSGALFHLTMVVVVLVAGHHLVLVVLLEMTIVVLTSSDHFRQIPHHVHQFGRPINRNLGYSKSVSILLSRVTQCSLFGFSHNFFIFFSLRLHIYIVP